VNQKWHILYCDDDLPRCPITEFIETCPPKHQVKILRFLSLLEELGPNLPRPYADILYDGVHELRVRLSGQHVRLLYFFCFQKFIILYYGFVKNTSRVPDFFIRKVITYREDFLARTGFHQLEALIDADL
jgi:hypothetical protein